MDNKHYFDKQFVESVRNGVIEEININCDDYDKRDVQRLKTCDGFVRQFLAPKPTNIETAVKCVNKAMSLRHSLRINDWTDSDFPSEFYQMASFFTYLPDREDNNVLIIRMKNSRTDAILKPHFDELLRKYFIYICEKTVRANNNGGLVIIFDCYEASVFSIDLEFCRFIKTTLDNHYAGVSFSCIYELPWMLNQIWRLISSWLDSETKKLVRFVTKNDIKKFIVTENLPDYMGGTATKNYRHIPEGTKSVEEMAKQFGINCENQVSKLNTFFQKLIEK